MTALIITRYVHFLAIFILFALLVAQHLQLKAEMTPPELKRLSRLDGFYGITALVVFLAGLVLWVFVGKPAHFYSANPIFHAKLGLFLAIGLLSIYPTITYIKLRKSTDASVVVPRRVVQVVRLELLLLLVIPLLAVLMAQGRGLS